MKERAVELATSKLKEIKLPWGLAHSKVEELIDKIEEAKSNLKAAGAKQELFNRRDTIGSLVG